MKKLIFALENLIQTCTKKYELLSGASRIFAYSLVLPKKNYVTRWLRCLVNGINKVAIYFLLVFCIVQSHKRLFRENIRKGLK